MNSDVKIHINGTDLEKDISIYAGKYKVSCIKEIGFKINNEEYITNMALNLFGISFNKCEIPPDEDAEVSIVFKDAVSKDEGFSTFNNCHTYFKVKGEMVGSIQELGFRAVVPNHFSLIIHTVGSKPFAHKFPDWVQHTHKLLVKSPVGIFSPGS